MTIKTLRNLSIHEFYMKGIANRNRGHLRIGILKPVKRIHNPASYININTLGMSGVLPKNQTILSYFKVLSPDIRAERFCVYLILNNTLRYQISFCMRESIPIQTLIGL